MQALVRVQARVRARRIQAHNNNNNNQGHHHHNINNNHGDNHDANDDYGKRGKYYKTTLQDQLITAMKSPTKVNYRTSSSNADEWDGRHHTFDEIKETSQRKHDAALRRERALAYAYNYQVR